MFDPLKIKNDFSVIKNNENIVYLDSAASSLKPDIVAEEVNRYYLEYGCNVSRGVYNLSYELTDLFENVRKKVSSFINCKKDEVIFTRSASSALNLVALSYGVYNLKIGDEVIVSELEHHSNLLPWQQVCKRVGAKLIYIPLTNDGHITVDNFKKVLTKKTKVVALTYVSNVLGYITPIKDIIKVAHQNNIIVSVDAAQAVPHMKIDVKDIDCDFLSFSGHKMLGPTGIGVLYGKIDLLNTMNPLEYGGDMNEDVDMYDCVVKESPYKFETGTPPIASVLGLEKSIEYLENIGFENIHKHESSLINYTIKKIEDIKGVTIYNKLTDTGVLTFNIDGVHPHDAATLFNEEGICMRAGHHCAQLCTKFLGVSSTLRVSFYVYNTYEDCDKFVEAIIKAREFFTSVGF